MKVSCRGGIIRDLPLDQTALLVIDMQRDFLDPHGMCAVLGDDLRLMQAIIPRVRRLSDWARQKGVSVIHTREGYAPDLSDRHPSKQSSLDEPSAGPLGRFLIRGEAGHDFITELQPAAGELVIDKPGFSAFYQTKLADHLAAAGITHLILSGVTTSCCVQSTMREAIDRGFHCLTIADCCAAIELDHHDQALNLIASEGHLFGAVCDLEDLAGPGAIASPSGIEIRTMADFDAVPVLAIYAAGIATGHATFQSETGDWAGFSAGKLATPRLVACDQDGTIQGFAALSPTSTRPIYRGICEVSIYVSPAATGRGIGHALLAQLISDSETAGIWALTAGIFPENKASLILHAAHGFRCMGRQTRAAKMPYGPMAGHWRDVLRLERRSGND